MVYCSGDHRSPILIGIWCYTLCFGPENLATHLISAAVRRPVSMRRIVVSLRLIHGEEAATARSPQALCTVVVQVLTDSRRSLAMEKAQ